MFSRIAQPLRQFSTSGRSNASVAVMGASGGRPGAKATVILNSHFFLFNFRHWTTVVSAFEVESCGVKVELV